MKSALSICCGETYEKRRTARRTEGQEKAEKRSFRLDNRISYYHAGRSGDLSLSFRQRLVEFHACHAGDCRVCICGGRYVRAGKGSDAWGSESIQWNASKRRGLRSVRRGICAVYGTFEYWRYRNHGVCSDLIYWGESADISQCRGRDSPDRGRAYTGFFPSGRRRADTLRTVRPPRASKRQALFRSGPDGGGRRIYAQRHGSDGYLYGGSDPDRSAGGDGGTCDTGR